MTEWEKLMRGNFFITDLGEDFGMERYAVWSPAKNSHQHIIVEVGNDLDALCEKYSVKSDKVCRLVR